MKNYNLLYFFFKKYLKRKGYGSIGGRRVLNMFCDDFFRYGKTSFLQKKWAYKRGFTSEKINRYQLNEENVNNFMPDAEYYKLQSHVNSPLGNWFDIKITTRYLLRKFDAYTEDYYLYIKKKQIIKLMDCPPELQTNFNSIVNWIREKGSLAAKSIKGSLGIGFYKLSYRDNKFHANQLSFNETQFISFLSGLNNYVLVGYLQSHENLRKIHNQSANALRIMTAYDYDTEKAYLTGSFIRFGTDKSGHIEHLIYGGILCGVDINDGQMYRPLKYEDGLLCDITEHPNTKEPLKGKISGWDLICGKVIEISEYLSVTPHLTYDIIVTDDGFRILEINSHSDLSNMQVYYPFFNNEHNKKLFKIDYNKK